MVQHNTIDHTGVPGVSGGSVATDAIWNAKGDLAGGTGADTAARLGVGANDLVLVAASGETTGLKWAVPVVPYVTADMSADVDLTADTPADATSASVSLVQGTWLIFGFMTFSTPSTSTYTVLYIANSSNTYFAEARGYVTSAGPITIAAHAIVTPGSTTTYKLRGQAGFSTADILRFGAGSTAGTRITAIRLA